ncbi:MAG: CaiB/BaiF CoA-transferase family protein, partial [Pseudomonadota bacterium]
MSEDRRQGPLVGVRVVEFTGLGPGPFAAMMLSDLGADVVRIDRPNSDSIMPQSPFDFMSRGRRRVELNLKEPSDLERALALIDQADALIEGFRPGVMEKLQLGPEACLERNPRLIYGRMTGWGQKGPLASNAGHDLNYLAISGALHAMGEPGRPPTPPLNLIADFGGGGQLLAFGIVSALLAARTTGQGQVVDAAMVDGCASLMTAMYGMLRMDLWRDE